MEALRTSDYADPSEDWKLNRNVECRITLNKLKIVTPEYETMEFCRMLTNRSAPKESTSTHTKDIHSNVEFILDVLLNDILGKCEEKCKVCEEYVQQLRHHIIQAHSRSHDAETVFKCDVCSSIYSSPSMLIRHRNTHSNNSDTFVTTCTNEPELVRFDSNNIYASFDISSLTRTNESASSGQFENHSHHPVPVSPMNFEWNSLKQESYELQSELEISNQDPLGILVNNLSTIENKLKQECDDAECHEDLRDPLLLQDLQVPAPVKYECTEISTESEQQTILVTHDYHMSSTDTQAGEEDQSQVRTCGNSFPDPPDLITHKITHTGQKPHKCDTCGKCFSKSHLLTRHKLIHSGKKPHSCGVCGKCFKLNSHLTQHRVTHTGEKPFHCDECGMCFALKCHLVRHKLKHTGEKPHKCDVCGKCFLRKPGLIRHKLTHTGEKSFGCDVCGRDFALNSNLTKHKLTHTGEGSFSCDVCGKCFSIRSNLTYHKLIHTGEKPHKCDVCGKCFLRRYALTQHKLTHTGETSFHCEVCGQRFNGRVELTQHKLMHTWESTTTTLVNHLKEERESEEEGCQEDPLLNLEVSS